MRARKLSLAEAHPSQVVKVEVDVASQYAAVLLRNTSCLVYSSLTGSSPSPSLIVPTCTDICFLRLRQRTARASSSSSSDKSAERFSGSCQSKVSSTKGKAAVHSMDGIDDSLPRAASSGSTDSRSVDEVLLFLALKSARGGACVDLLAWRCNQTDIVQIPIFADAYPNNCDGSLVARFDDISHGISAGILASVNVVAIHSPASEKLWIFSAKYSSTKSHGLLAEPVEKDQSEIANEKHAKEISHGIQLVKSAVVDCNGPVYAMWLSMQHLLVGQLGGVRVWPLRPLIKGSESAKSRTKAASNCGKCLRMRQEKFSPSEEEESGKSIGELVKVSNGSFSAAIERTESFPTLKVGYTAPTAPKNGFHEMVVNQSTGTSNSYINGYNCTSGNTPNKKHFWGCNGKSSSENSSYTHHVFTRSSASLDMLQDNRANISKALLMEAAGIPRAFDSEDIKSQQKFSQISMLSSCSDSSISLPHLQTSCPYSASCQSLTSSLSSVAGVTGTINHKSELKKGTSAGVFIALQNGHSTASGKVEQVIKIHGLSEKDFLVLDSNGKLFLLTLHYVMLNDEASMYRARFSLKAHFQHLACGIRIKYMSAVPGLHSNPQSPGSALSKLWVSDGGHTLYKVTMSSKEHAKDDSQKTPNLGQKNMTVVGTVFLMEHACSLFALHENAVLVRTGGSMLEYSSGS